MSAYRTTAALYMLKVRVATDASLTSSAFSIFLNKGWMSKFGVHLSMI
jgi:hypothetical protein